MRPRITLCSATLGDQAKTEPPLGPLYVAATLEKKGFEIDFRDYQLCPEATAFDIGGFVDFLADHEDIIAISCFVDMLPLVLAATRRLYENRPDTKILLGGPGPTAAARPILERFPWVSGVVRGEGELTISEWAEGAGVDHSMQIPGLVFRSEGQIIDGGDRHRNAELDSLPLPAYHLLDWDKYTHARVITTRGCSYRCSFCDVTALWGNRSMFRSLECVISEIELLRDTYGMDMIAVVDDTFVLNRKRVHEFCRLLIERDTSIGWGCFGRINLMTEKLIEDMVKSGCSAVFYGIDSGSEEILDKTVKRIRKEDILPCLEMSSTTFKKVEASFIWGFPFESWEQFLSTVELAGEASQFAPVVNVQLHMLSPLPLSPIYLQNPDHLSVPEEADRDWLLLPPLLLEKNCEELTEMVRENPDIFPGFYTFPTPSKERKRARLEESLRALNATIGRTLFDKRANDLLTNVNRSSEISLLDDAKTSEERIGVGLALGMFRRTRRRRRYAESSSGERSARAEPATV